MTEIEVVAPLIAVVLVIGVIALVFGVALWLVLFTPVVRWAFYAVVAFLCLRLVLLPSRLEREFWRRSFARRWTKQRSCPKPPRPV